MQPKLAIFLMFLSLPVWAKFAPETPWETVHSQHFRIHFPATYRQFAGQLSGYLEEAYGVLSQDLHWELKEAADVVVRGDTDIPNGSTSVFPINRIVVHPVPFLPISSVGEYDHWIRTLAYHELTHLVANDATSGFFAFARSVMGSVAKMNAYQPQWIVEGLAVYEETIHSKGGRGRSVFTDTLLRAAVLSGELENESSFYGVTLDRLNDGVPIWPAKLTPYLYGYLMQAWVAQRAGENAPGRISQKSAQSLPFLVDQVAQSTVGAGYSELWSKLKTRLKEMVEQDLKTIRAQPLSQVKVLSKSGRMSGGLAISKDQSKGYFVRDSFFSGVGITEVDLKSGVERDLSDWIHGGESRIKIDFSGRYLIYCRYQPFEEFNSYSDVFAWDLDQNREIRLTEGARAVSADIDQQFRISPNGQWEAGQLIYVKNLPNGNQSLVLYDQKNERQLFATQNFERISHPSWGLSQGQAWVVFSYKPNLKGENLKIIQLSDGRVRDLTRTSNQVLQSQTSSSWTHSGDVLFSNSAEGVFNIYRVSLQGEPVKLTHVELGLWSPVESTQSDKVFAMHLGPHGFDVSEVTVLKNLQAQEIEPTHEKIKTGPEVYPAVENEKLATNQGESVSKKEQEQDSVTQDTISKTVIDAPYSVLPTLWPKYWYPYGQKVSDGWLIGASTSGYDALEQHHYTVIGSWDSRATFLIYDLSYRYEGLYPSIQVQRKRENKYLGFIERSNAVDTTNLVFYYPLGFWGVGFGATLAESRFLDEKAASGGLQVKLGFSDLRSYPSSIDLEAGQSGQQADLALTGYFVGDQQFSAAEARFEKRIPSFFERHFIRLLAQGARSTNEQISALYFLGGGESTVAKSQDYLLRGYPAGTLVGRTIATLNFEYWLPFWDVERGAGVWPAFFERSKLKLFADTGSSEFVGVDERNFTVWPVGVGIQMLHDLKLFYRLPISLGLGLDWGLSARNKGEKQFVLGLYIRN